MLFGRPCRGAMSALIARQHYEHEESITPNLRWSLDYIVEALRHMPAKSIPITPCTSKPVVVYTDASDEPGRTRVGGMVLVPGAKPAVFVYDVSPKIRPLLGPQTAVINQAELLAGPLLLFTAPDLLRGRDVIWFVDNANAEAALVKAGSPTCTMCYLALLASASLAGLNIKAWFDHVPSKDNPADALSRDGLQDADVKPKIENGEWEVLDVVEPPTARLSFADLWKQCKGH